MRVLKKYLFLIVALALFICPMQVQASKKKDVTQITKHIKSYMTAVKKYDIQRIKKENNNISVYHWTYKPMQKHIQKLNKKYMSYSIKKITVKGNTAVVTLKVTSYGLYDDSRRAMYDLVWKMNKKWSGDKVVKTYINLIKEKYKENLEDYADDPDGFNTQFIFTSNTRIPLKKVNGKWAISKMTKDMIMDLDCGSSQFIKDFEKDPTIIF